MRDQFFRSGVLCLVIFLFSACSLQVGRQNSTTRMLGGQGEPLDKAGSFLIALPPDFGPAGNPEKDSGLKTQAAMVEAFKKQGGAYAQTSQSALEPLLAEAREAHAAYVLTMRIALWDDPPSFLQQRPDKGQINISVYDAASGQRLRADTVECEGYPTLINHIGSGGPEDCLCQGFEEWLSKAVK